MSNSNEIMENSGKEELAGSNLLSHHIVGPPKRSSSPTIGMSGDGDGHSLRTVHSLLSPIRSSRASHRMNCASLDSPPEAIPVHLDSFLANFEKNLLSTKKATTVVPLHEDIILDDSIEAMNLEDVKKQLITALIENKGLRDELRTKERRITAYKGQMLAILEWKTRQTDKENGVEGAEATDLIAKIEGDKTNQEDMIPQIPIRNVQGITVVNQEVFSVRRSLSFIQEIASSIDVDQELLRHRFKDGCYLTNQLIVGGLAGWMSALFVKKFGKIALSAVGGGMLLLVYTARKGYVNVNYESIYEEISHLCDDVDGPGCDGVDGTNNGNPKPISDANQEEDDLEGVTRNWAVRDKLRNAKKWVTSHSYTVGGFCLGFIYNLV
ncbi:FUN14 domain-containing protein 1 [Orchesella cincta]|uniref:FUN14 domain-containing protein 1 n=1 Tax=Orchesella cincta TaxID=48709 RepID=A0A1D2NIH8_ORCCI|nr:FUN14 domain-containing protein 1 [Orchesella cincta]